MNPIPDLAVRCYHHLKSQESDKSSQEFDKFSQESGKKIVANHVMY
jgi:hypothetical protein